MRQVTPFMLCLAVVVGGCARSTPEARVVADAVKALGGDRVASAQTLSIEGEGTNYNLGQDLRPGARTQTFRVTGYTRILDLRGNAGRMRVEQTRTPEFPYFAGQQPQTQVSGLDGAVAYAVAPNGTATRAPEMAARERLAEFYHHPLPLLRAAQRPDAKVTNARREGDERLVDIETPDGAVLTLAIDAASSRPNRISSRSAHPNLGDVTIATRFSDYQDVNGIMLPSRWSTATDDFVTAVMRATTQTLDGTVADVAAPSSAASAPAPPAPAPAVTAEAVAPGVWWLAGQSHHSVVVEFKDHLMLIEAPQSEARALAVIAKARELRPGKPVTHVVNTHHHFDHTAGIRAAISEGLTVVTQRGNVDFFEDIASRPHTIVPDALAKKPSPLKLEAVDDSRTFQDESMTVTVYHVAGNPHTETMLMAHLPKQKLLVEVDAFTPGSAVSPYSPNLLENIRKHNLQIDRVVPLHSTMAPYSELVSVAGGGR